MKNRIRVKIFEVSANSFRWMSEMKDGKWLGAGGHFDSRFAAAAHVVRYFGVYPQNRVVFVCQSGEGFS